MAYVRFPIPEFKYDQFKNMAWSAPTFLADVEIKRLIDGQKAGDASVYGGYPIKPPDAFFDQLGVRGDHRHAVMCVLPKKPVKVLGRSHSWYIQRAVVVDSLDPSAIKTLFDWKTARPINTRLGPDNGLTIDGGVVYAVGCRSYADYWLGNRTIIDNQWNKGRGFRILSPVSDDVDDFHGIYLAFEWDA